MFKQIKNDYELFGFLPDDFVNAVEKRCFLIRMRRYQTNSTNDTIRAATQERINELSRQIQGYLPEDDEPSELATVEELNEAIRLALKTEQELAPTDKEMLTAQRQLYNLTCQMAGRSPKVIKARDGKPVFAEWAEELAEQKERELERRHSSQSVPKAHKLCAQLENIPVVWQLEFPTDKT